MAKKRKIDLLPTTKREETRFRGLITASFVGVYLVFIIITVALWGLSLFFPLRGSTDELKDLTLTISGVFSGPLGLMIGYYFRVEQERLS